MIASLKEFLRPHYHTAIRKPLFTVLPPLLKYLPVSSKVLGPPKKLVPNTKDWVEQYNLSGTHMAAGYTKVYDGQEIARTPPKSLASSLHPVFKENTAQSKDAFAASIPNGRVWHTDGAIITPDDCLLEDVSAEYDHERYVRGRHSAFSQMRLPALHTETGTVAVLTTLSASYYSHWLLDILPRVDLLQKAGHSLDAIDKFYLLEPKASYHWETLERLGIPATKIIDSKRIPHLQAQNLVVPSLPGGAFQPTQWVCQYLRSQFANTESVTVKPRRIYISRANANYRRILNEDQVTDLLHSLGFCTIYAETLSIAEKVALFSTAEAVVFPAGSGYVNIVFCQPETVVIEIFNPCYVDIPTWALANELGLDYYYALGKDYRTSALPIATDIMVNITALVDTLNFAGIK